jgi:hypothetical protein
VTRALVALLLLLLALTANVAYPAAVAVTADVFATDSWDDLDVDTEAPATAPVSAPERSPEIALAATAHAPCLGALPPLSLALTARGALDAAERPSRALRERPLRC